jgi:hypothetical protein
VFSSRTGWSRIRGSILLGTAAYLGGGAAIAFWQSSIDSPGVVFYSRVVGAAVLVGLAAASFWLSYLVSREFSSGEPLRAGWLLIALSAAFDLLGVIADQVLAADSVLNSPTLASRWSPESANAIRGWGLFLEGPCRFAFLAAGMMFVLLVYRRSGLMGKLRLPDWGMAGALALYVLWEMGTVAASIERGRGPGLTDTLRYSTDPILLLLLAETMLLYRSVKEMGAGRVGWCWQLFSLAIFLTALGDFLLLRPNYGYLPWPWSAIDWFIWFPAAAAFAVAPTYQLEAIDLARTSQTANLA